ncbi:MAG: hypothetical protein AAGE88_19230 [Actinomycetota bacterium]
MSTVSEAGRQLAERHQQRRKTGPAVERPIDLANLSERERESGWSFRASLVRFAQPEPLRGAVIMEFLRRSELALQPVNALLDDGRAVELARLLGADGDADRARELAAGYRQGLDLDPAVDDHLLLLAAVLILDDLGERLSTWAPTAPAPAPLAAVDAALSQIRDRFDDLEVPVETGPPGPRRGRRR